MKTVRWIRAPVDKVEDIRRWSTRRAGRAPGTPFSWATCDKTKVEALPIIAVKSSQGLLFSEAKKPYAEAVGQTGHSGVPSIFPLKPQYQ